MRWVGTILVVSAAVMLCCGSPAQGENGAAGRMGPMAWQKPGCHRVGHTRLISIPQCVEFHMTTNACRGFCESWSLPSSPATMSKNPGQIVTSIGHCCNIMETEDVTARVMCVDGPREVTFKSAKSCSCFHCKKN